MQLNAICRLAKFMASKEKVAMINSLVYSIFNYYHLVWHFCSCESSQKIEKIQKRCLRSVLDDYESDYGNLIKKNGYSFIFNGFNIFIGFYLNVTHFLRFSHFHFVMIFMLFSESK